MTTRRQFIQSIPATGAEASTMVDFDPRFEIMPGTKVRDTQLAHADPYEAVPGPTIAE